MTPATLREWQSRLGLSQPAAASALGVSVRTYHGWMQGRRGIPDMVERLCWYVETYGAPPTPYKP